MVQFSFEFLVNLLEEAKFLGHNSVAISDDNWRFLSQEVGRCVVKNDPDSQEKCSINQKKISSNTVGPYVETENLDQIVPNQNSKEQGDKRERWEALRKEVLSNPDLLKHVRPGKNLVFGCGNLDTKIFFCGEAPGAEEEMQGEPFVGRAGQLLTKIIGAMGLSRSEVYIGNIMNWRPEMDTSIGNRPPTQEEMEYCLPYLLQQINIVQPKVIVALGATAVNGLLGIDKSRRMSQVRGNWAEFYHTPLMITFHPSYILRNNTNAMKRLIWEDMMKVMDRVGMVISERQKQYFSEVIG